MVPGQTACIRIWNTLESTGQEKERSAPTLEKRHHKYFLRFSYTEEKNLSKTGVKAQTICSVDLGINTDAVCTIMRADGTVLGRRFEKLPQ